MGETGHEIEMQEICSIQIAFAVESDEQAIVYKKKISAILVDLPSARIDFSLTSMPKLSRPNADRPTKLNQ